MPEYTYKDIIIDPTSEEAKNCIGKEVYFGDDPTTCLSHANNGKKGFCKILQRIELDGYRPFVIDINCVRWGSIIPKKEEPEPKFVPFESVDEFLDAYENTTYNITCDSVENKLINRGGIWLKQEYVDSSDYYNVTEICDKLGLAIGYSTSSISWNVLLKNFKFLDGTPCGKIKE